MPQMRSPHGLMVSMFGGVRVQVQILVNWICTGLVCNPYGNNQCINPKKGMDGGQTWEYRRGYIDAVTESKKNEIENADRMFRTQFPDEDL